MFEFLTRRHAAPAETPLSEVRFTREELFVLLGGCDTGMFANGEFTIDFDWIERRGTDPWRRDMAARLSPTGLVDAEGTPSDELAEALYPLNKPGISVNDGSIPQVEGERDRRTVSMVIYEGQASALVASGGRRAGFKVTPLPTGEELDPTYRKLVMAPPLRNAGADQSFFFRPDPEIGGRVARGDVDWAKRQCVERGEDPEQLCGFVGMLASDRSLRRSGRQFVSADYRTSAFDDSLGFLIPQAEFPGFRKKNSFVYLSEGVALVEATSYSVEENRFDEFASIEFVHCGTLVDYLSHLISCPDQIKGSERRSACSSS